MQLPCTSCYSVDANRFAQDHAWPTSKHINRCLAHELLIAHHRYSLVNLVIIMFSQCGNLTDSVYAPFHTATTKFVQGSTSDTQAFTADCVSYTVSKHLQ